MEQGLLFDVEFYEKLNSKLKDDEKKKEAYELASEVQLPFYESPVNDNEKLFNYQYAWYKQNNYEARQQMFLLGYKVLQRLLWSYLKKKSVLLTRNARRKLYTVLLSMCSGVLIRVTMLRKTLLWSLKTVYAMPCFTEQAQMMNSVWIHSRKIFQAGSTGGFDEN